MSWYFPPFRFDAHSHVLWRDNTRIAFQSRPAAVLEWLVRNAGTVVTNETLIQNLWSPPSVGATAVTRCISRIRKALNDESHSPRYIETRPRLGYRFIGRLARGRDDTIDRSRLVDAEGPLALMRGHFDAADCGNCRVVFVTGATGSGKTALCERFIREIGDRDGVWIGRGRCSPTAGMRLLSPIVEALADMCGTTPDVLDAVERLAPSWLRSLFTGAAIDPLEVAFALQRPDTPSRMVRELGRMFETVAQQRTIVLFIDDVHHADRRTVELLESLGRGPDSQRILVLVTIRPDETVRCAYEFATMRVELNLRHRSADVPLVRDTGCTPPSRWGWVNPLWPQPCL